MNGNKRIDGKNAILIFNDEKIKITYKNAFGDLIGLNKNQTFTYDDVDEIEYKKPGITMNGFILFVLKNSDMHKVVLNKLDEYSLEITDEFVKGLESKVEVEDHPPIMKLDDKDETSNRETVAIIPKREITNNDINEEKKDSIKVSENAIKIAGAPITVIKQKTSKEIEKDKLREEIRLKVEEKRKEEKNGKMIIQGNRIIDDSVEIPTIPIRPKVFIREEAKDKPADHMTVKRIVTKENTDEVGSKEEEKSSNLPLPTILKKINLHIGKDKKKSEEFGKNETKTIRVGEVTLSSDGKDRSSVPIDVSVRPLKKEELEELEKKKNDVIIDELKHKLYVIQSELNELTFKLIILKKYVDTTYDEEKIKALIKQIEDLIKVLEAIKQELINKMNGKDYVANKALDVTGDDIVNIDDFKTIYVKALDRISEFEAELNIIKEKTNERQKEVEITDKQFAEDSKKLKEKQELVKQYDDFIQRTNNYAELLKYQIGHDKITSTEYYIKNVKQIKNDTKLLATLSAISLATPGINGPTTAILTTATGIAAIRDAIIPTEKIEITVEEAKPVDYSKEINKTIKDVNEASEYITKAKKDITDIKKEINDNYINFPEYKDLLEGFDKLEAEIDRQEKVLSSAIYTLNGEYSMNNNQKILILEKEDDH